MDIILQTAWDKVYILELVTCRYEILNEHLSGPRKSGYGLSVSLAKMIQKENWWVAHLEHFYYVFQTVFSVNKVKLTTNKFPMISFHFRWSFTNLSLYCWQQNNSPIVNSILSERFCRFKIFNRRPYWWCCWMHISLSKYSKGCWI